jgi:C1A family cysteine protease
VLRRRGETPGARLAVPQTLDDLQACLAAGFPFVFGFTVYASFESDYVGRTGHVSMPNWFERPVGGHAVMAVGYDNAASTFTVRNSWGPGWGTAATSISPYPYMTESLSSDFWTIRTVE